MILYVNFSRLPELLHWELFIIIIIIIIIVIIIFFYAVNTSEWLFNE